MKTGFITKPRRVLKSLTRALADGRYEDASEFIVVLCGEDQQYMGVSATVWLRWCIPGYDRSQTIQRYRDQKNWRPLSLRQCEQEFGCTLIGKQYFESPRLVVNALRLAKLLAKIGISSMVSGARSTDVISQLNAGGSASLALTDLAPPFGQGVLAMNAVSRGECLTEYLGKVSFQHPRFFVGSTTYVMEYPLPGIFGFQWIIDARCFGNIARFINHSREPNAQVEVFFDGVLPRLAILALSDIQAGEQITIHYGSEYWRERDEQLSGEGENILR